MTESGIGNVNATGIPITRFLGENAFLSNFWPVEIVMDGIKFPTLEHAYQAAKAIKREDQTYIANLATPGKAKYWGKRIKMRPDWDAIKIETMTVLVALKFKSGSLLATKLVQTGDRELIEGNSWGDTYWGVYNNKGANHLGIILMARRSELRAKGSK